MEIRGKKILITGGSQGIGRYLAVHFAERGAHLVLMARSDSNLRKTAGAVEEVGGKAELHVADLRKPESLAAMVQAIEATGQAVDILINNAADVTSKPFLETSPEEIDGLIRTNVIGALQLTRLVAPGMVQRGSGLIVNISSLAGYKPNPRQCVYSISKGAVNAMSEALRAELRGTGVRVMNVALSSIGDGPGQVLLARFARKLEGAIARESAELFLSPMSKWLMRLYGVFPGLAGR